MFAIFHSIEGVVWVEVTIIVPCCRTVGNYLYPTALRALKGLLAVVKKSC